MLQVSSLRIEFENDGAPRLLGPQAESYLLLQWAPHPRLEVGLDLYSVGSSNRSLLNAKWLARTEGKGRPALGLGVLELGKGYTATGYLVATKDVGRGLRLHAGGALRGGSGALLLGMEQQIGRKDYLLADYASWPDGYLSLGIYREFSSGVAINLAYAWPNDRGAPGLVLCNLSRTMRFR